MKIPKYAVDQLKDKSNRLEDIFASVWGILPRSYERDEIMHYLFTAKHKLNEFIKENDTDGKVE